MFLCVFYNCTNEVETLLSENLENSQVIAIQNLSFIPRNITASPGEVVFFYNDDGHIHQIASQSQRDAFDNTQDFETLPFDDQDVVAITIPEDSEMGDVFYFYCAIFKDTMVIGNGSITIVDENTP